MLILPLALLVLFPIWVLFQLLLCKRRVAMWVWLPITSWSIWLIWNLAETVLPGDARSGPPEWGYLGLAQAIEVNLFIAAIFTVAGALLWVPRRVHWKSKPILLGLLFTFCCPLACWFLFSIPVKVKVIDPEGNPLAGVTIYHLKPRHGNRLAAVATLVSDEMGVATCRVLSDNDLSFLVPGTKAWTTTTITVGLPLDGIRDANQRNYREVKLSWGETLSSSFESALLHLPSPTRYFQDPNVRGRAGWMIHQTIDHEPVPIFLHNRSHPQNVGLRLLLTSQIKDPRLSVSFPSFIGEVSYSGYGLLLSEEIRQLHIEAGKTNPVLESHVRLFLKSQGELLQTLRHGVDQCLHHTGTAKENAYRELLPWLNWFGLNDSAAGEEAQLHELETKVTTDLRLLIDHIRAHPSTDERSLSDFEAMLKEPRN